MVDREKLEREQLRRYVEDKQRQKGKVPPEHRSTLPGIEHLIEYWNDDYPLVHISLGLWESCQEVSTEQALVQMVMALAAQNKELFDMNLQFLRASTRPIILNTEGNK